jgi:predicted glycosyltransferase
MELSHLIPRLFKPDPNIIKQYGVDPYLKYFILRFVSWDASHDLGYNGLSIKIKREIVDLLSKYGRVLISSEPGLPADLEQYRLKIRPADLHHFLAFAQMYIGEGATTAAESIFLGTSAVTFINTLDAGTIKEQHDKYGLISVKDASKFVENVQNQLVTNYKEIAKINRLKVLTDKIDVTAFMCWFVENFPESRELLKKDSEIQYQFKIAEEDGD